MQAYKTHKSENPPVIYGNFTGKIHFSITIVQYTILLKATNGKNLRVFFMWVLCSNRKNKYNIQKQEEATIMKFTKMHGIGNDYVYVNCFEETVKDPAAVAKFVSDRHFGIGSDGLILIRPSEIADCEMDMYNLDGSQGAMCGNGIRCVAKYVYDHGIVDKTSLSIATRSGIKYVDLTIRDGKASMVKVNMGSPILTAKEIPVVAETEQVIDAPITSTEKNIT